MTAAGPAARFTGAHGHLRAALRTGRGAAGMTLVEMLVAMTLTLLLMGAVAQVFGMLGQGVNGSRSMAELNDRLRAAGQRLRQDLAGITVAPAPPVRPELNSGYLEIIEGPLTDISNALAVTAASDDRLVGDVDDVLLFTTRSPGDMFAGRTDTTITSLEGSSVRSPYAEVAWFCRLMDKSTDPHTYTLYRRQRIVSAQPGTPPFVDPAAARSLNKYGSTPNTIPFTNLPALYALTDVSLRKQGTDAVPNSLGDLTRRENRFLHVSGPLFEFPHPFYVTDPTTLATLTFSGTSSPRFGEDIILTNVIGFDVKVWDPGMRVKAVVSSTGSDVYAVRPGDPGYGFVNAVPSPVFGVYADLTAADTFRNVKQGPLPGNVAVDFTYATYDTWSTAHETNGIDDDGDGIIDDGANGLDDNSNGAIDEPEERETRPPYPVTLQGIQVRLRVYEPSSRQIRQITILQSF